MKKIFLLLAMTGTLAFTGCTDDDVPPQVIENNNTFVSEAFQINNVNLALEPSTGRFEILTKLQPRLYPSDVILVYRMVNDNGTSVWQQIPRTLYLSGEDEVDYDFNFNRDDLLIFADATFDLATAPEFLNNQTFRVVIIPADDASMNRINYDDYNAVAERLEIKESDVRMIN